MKNGIDHVINSIDAQIAELERSKAIILAAAETVPVEDAPKVKRGRKPRKAGLPSAVPPASEANLTGRL